MKTPQLLTRITVIGLLFIGISCTKSDDPAADAYKSAIADKYKALGWDTQNTSVSGDAVKTKGDKGYVQYYTYNGRKRAIYYYDTGTFGLQPDLVEKYDALGQETFTHLGLLKSDSKICGSGCIYADFEKGVIIKSPAVTPPVTVYGAIYDKYAALNKWDGVLGYPTTDELDLTSKRGRYNGFKGGQIFWSSSTGAHAFSGKTEALYKATGFDTGWLGLPISTIQYYGGNQAYLTNFENGAIGIENNAKACGFYLNNTYAVDGSTRQGVLQDGKTKATSAQCY